MSDIGQIDVQTPAITLVHLAHKRLLHVVLVDRLVNVVVALLSSSLDRREFQEQLKQCVQLLLVNFSVLYPLPKLIQTAFKQFKCLFLVENQILLSEHVPRESIIEHVHKLEKAFSVTFVEEVFQL